MNSKEALEFLTEGICNCPNCSKYVECMDLDESESVCENAKFIIKKDLIKLEQLEKENQVLKEQVDYYKKEMESEQCFRESNQNYLMKYIQAIKILKEIFALELGVSVVKEQYCYSLEDLFNNSYFSITKEEYELLKEVLENE